MSEDQQQLYVPSSRVAALFGCSLQTANRWIDDGIVPGIRMGARRFAAAAFIAQLRDRCHGQAREQASGRAA